MNTLRNMAHSSFAAAALGIALLSGGCAMMKGNDGATGAAAVTMSGAQEVPPILTAASGKSMIRIGGDRAVSGTVTISGMTATAAHIHQGAQGANGPVIVPLTRTSETTFSVPANARLTDAQYAAYKAGGLYVNVHSAAYPGGELRAQLPAK